MVIFIWICLFLFFIHLKLELLTRFPASSDKNSYENWTSPILIYGIDWAFTKDYFITISDIYIDPSHTGVGGKGFTWINMLVIRLTVEISWSTTDADRQITSQVLFRKQPLHTVARSHDWQIDHCTYVQMQASFTLRQLHQNNFCITSKFVRLCIIWHYLTTEGRGNSCLIKLKSPNFSAVSCPYRQQASVAWQLMFIIPYRDKQQQQQLQLLKALLA